MNYPKKPVDSVQENKNRENSHQLAYLPNFVILPKGSKKSSETKIKSKPKIWLWIYFAFKNFLLNILFLIYQALKQIRVWDFALRYNIKDLKQIIIDPESRHLFKLNLNLNTKLWLDKKIPLLKKTILLSGRANLLILVILVVLVTKLLPINGIQYNRSFLSQAIENYSIKSNFVDFNKDDLTNLLTKDKKLEDEFRIKKHEVKEGETVDSIAEEYGILADTLIINNKIEKDKPMPKTLYFPWQDSYLYFASADIKPKELSDIYKVDEKEIYSQNEDILNYETGTFAKDKIVIIPTKDFANIKKIEEDRSKKQKEEDSKREIEDRKKKFAETYQNQLNQKLVNGQLIQNGPYSGNPNNSADPANSGKYSDQFSSDKRSSGFIWPTKGVISRCIQPGHEACDIANASMPPVYAVQDAIVEDVYRFTVYGYGNAVVLNHGNGIKTLYAHMNEIYVTKGQTVAQGQAIGQMGNTGNSTGTHLHMEVIDRGVKQNPLAYLP
jgi:murein DD-endopeptidase MepM/ murein hydrolase activator NlpD